MAEVGEQRQGSSEEEGGAGEKNGALLGPRDEIKISVKQFKKSDNDQTYVYDIEVVPRPPVYLVPCKADGVCTAFLPGGGEWGS